MIEEKTPQKTATIITGTITGSTYSQLVGVTVTDVDITLEFVFINPRDNTKGEVVSRVTLPLNIGIGLAKTILDTIKMHEKRKTGGKDD
ncbi:MAG: hypothetical protein Q8P89_04415 [bacterium]|nr:hypothetical protein [bacterium]